MITVYVGGWNDDFSNLIMTHIHMPVSEDAIKHALSDIGVDVENGGDYRIRSFSSEFENIARSLKTTDSIWEVNTLARAISEMDELDRHKLNAACVLRECGGAGEILHLTANLEDYDYLPADNDEALGEFELETCKYDIPDGLIDYIDCAKLGRETRLRQGGAYVGIGYIYEIRDEVIEQNNAMDFNGGARTEPGNEFEDEEWER